MELNENVTEENNILAFKTYIKQQILVCVSQGVRGKEVKTH